MKCEQMEPITPIESHKRNISNWPSSTGTGLKSLILLVKGRHRSFVRKENIVNANTGFLPENLLLYQAEDRYLESLLNQLT